MWSFYLFFLFLRFSFSIIFHFFLSFSFFILSFFDLSAHLSIRTSFLSLRMIFLLSFHCPNSLNKLFSLVKEKFCQPTVQSQSPDLPCKESHSYQFHRFLCHPIYHDAYLHMYVLDKYLTTCITSYHGCHHYYSCYYHYYYLVVNTRMIVVYFCFLNCKCPGVYPVFVSVCVPFCGNGVYTTNWHTVI